MSKALPLIFSQMGGWDMLHGPVSVAYSYFFDSAHRRDVFNYEKLLSDTLTKAGVWADDSQIVYGVVKKMPIDKESPRVEVIITAL